MSYILRVRFVSKKVRKWKNNPPPSKGYYRNLAKSKQVKTVETWRVTRLPPFNKIVQYVHKTYGPGDYFIMHTLPLRKVLDFTIRGENRWDEV